MDRFRQRVRIPLEARIIARDTLSMGYGHHSVMFTRHAGGPLVRRNRPRYRIRRGEATPIVVC